MNDERPLPAGLEQLGAEHDSVRALLNAAAAVDSGLLIVTCADTGLAIAAAVAVARAEASGQHDPRADLDLHVAVSATATWTVGEVEDLIARPARLRPISRTHIVVTDAHQMAPAAADRLLKVVEEPRNDVLFWFTAPTLESIRTTLRSRASRTLAVRPLTGPARLQALLDAGADAGDAERIDLLAGTNSRLAVAVARDGLADALATYRSTLEVVAAGQVPAPTSTGAAWAEATVQLGAALARSSRRRGDGRQPLTWDKLTVAGKAETRRLAREGVRQVASTAEKRVATTTGATALASVEATLRACAAAHTELDTNGSVLTVLTALAARVR